MSTRVDLSPRVQVAGNDLAARWLDGLLHLRVERGLGLVGRAVLRFADPGFALSASARFAIGVDVKVSAPGTEGQLIDGVVTAVELEQYAAHSVPELVVTVDDRATRLAGSANSRTFLNQTVSQVVGSVCTGVGLKASVQGGDIHHPYLLQVGADLAFVTETLHRAGLVWWIDAQGALRAVPAGTSTRTVSLELGADLHSFSVRASAAAPDTVQVSGWDQVQQSTITTTASTTNSKGRQPAFVAGATGRGRAGTRGWPSKALVAAPAPLTNKEADVLAEALASEASAASVTMTATSTVDARLAPCVMLQVTGAGPAAGDYLLTQVEHVYSRTGFHTRVTAGPVRPSGLVGLLGSQAPATAGTMGGLVPGIVTNAADNERRGMGLVKVTFPGITGNVESTWARILSLGGGNRRGAVFQPEVGDEVLVGFEHGDTRRAVVLGGLHSEKAAMPHADTVDGDKVKYRRITSRQGHVLEFADGEGDTDQHVLITANQGKHRIRLGNDRLDLEVGNVPVLIRNGAGASIEFTAQGDVKIKGKNVTIESTAGATGLKAATELTLKGTTALKAESLATEIKGSATTKVEASGMLSVKGATVAIN